MSRPLPAHTLCGPRLRPARSGGFAAARHASRTRLPLRDDRGHGDPGQSIARPGRNARTEDDPRGGGRQAGQFHWPHVVANDSDGNMYVGEVDGAARIQKFLRYGATGCSGTGIAEVGRYLVQ